MAIDITKAISANEIKNGTVVVTCGVSGFPDSPASIVYNKYVKNTPTISDIDDKYDNRFYNGIFVELVGTSGVIGV